MLARQGIALLVELLYVLVIQGQPDLVRFYSRHTQLIEALKGQCAQINGLSNGQGSEWEGGLE